MTGQLDPNDIAARVVIQLSQNAATVFSSGVMEQIRDAKVKLQIGFRRYIEAMIANYGYVKTIFSQDDPIPIQNLYVSVRLSQKQRQVSDLNILEDLSSIRKMIVTGPAGTGKSMFLKHALYHTLSNYTYILPIYIELRYMREGESIFDVSFKALNSHAPDVSEKIFREGLKANRFAIFLDGFDELPLSLRQKALSEIWSLCREYPSIILVITTRPTDAILSLPNFSNVRVVPFTISQIVMLLGKIDADREKYLEFTAKLKAGAYDEHLEFLSNPLLATMMFITFCRVSDISSKMHIFYNDAFHVLAQWHDRSKGAYTREFKSGLDISAFKDLFAVFCAYTYFDMKYAFSEVELRTYVASAAGYLQIHADVAKIIDDLTESTSLIQRDGLNYTFVHRSFQEYFTAAFLRELADEEMCVGIDALAERGQTDNVLFMLRDMQGNRFDSAWLLPYIAKIHDRYGNLKQFNAVRYLRAFPRSVVFRASAIRFVFEDDNVDALKLAAIRRIFNYDKIRDIQFSDLEKSIWPTFKEKLALPKNKALANRFRAAFGVEWEFKVSTGETTRFPRDMTLSLEGIPNDVLEWMGVTDLLREEVAYLGGLVNSLGRTEERKRLGLKQMLESTLE